jgi:hypothetical protein
MSHMGAGEEKAMAAHASDMAAAFGAPIHGHMLANRVVRPDDEPAVLTAVFLILRRSAQHCEGVDFGAVSDLGPPGYDGVRVDLDAIAKRHIGSYDGEGADLDAGPKFRIRIDRR